MLELSPYTDHKKKTLIEFESLLEMTKSTMQVKPSRQMMTLTHPNTSSAVLSAPNMLNSWAWTSQTFTSTPISMIMNICGYHDEVPPNISLMKIRINTDSLKTEYLSKFAKECMDSHKQDDLPILR